MRPAPLALLLLLVAGCDSTLPDLSLPPPWNARFGDGADQTVSIASIDHDGNTALAGPYTGTIDFGGGPLPPDEFEASIFIAALDAYGHQRWSVPVIGGFVSPRGLAATPDGWLFTASYSDRTVVAGTVVDTFGDGVLLAALDAAGKLRWIKHWSADDGGPSGVGTADPVAGVAVDARGDIVVAGTFMGTFGFGGAFVDAPDSSTFITKLDAEGRELWATQYRAGDVGATTAPSAMVLDPGGDIIVAGSSTSFKGVNGFVARFDENGKLRSDRIFAGPGTSQVNGVAVDPRGDMIIAGTYNGQVRIGDVVLSSQVHRGFAAALPLEGNARWATSIGEAQAPSFTMATSVVADDAGVIVGGMYAGPLGSFPVRPSVNAPSGFISELSPTGEVGSFQVLSPTVGDASEPPLLGLAGGDLVMGGSFMGDVARDGVTLHSAGGRDVFVSRAPR